MPTPKKRRTPAKKPAAAAFESHGIASGMSRTKLAVIGLASVALMFVAYAIGGSFFQTSLFSTNQKASILRVARAQIGKPYVFGATGSQVFDCSSLMQHVLKTSVNVSLPRVSRDQALIGRAIIWDNLGTGDLVFFDTTGAGRVSHVGIVSKREGGRVWMINANSVEGKVVEEEVKGYWLASGRYKGAREITDFTKDVTPTPEETTVSVATAPSQPPETAYVAANGQVFAEIPQSEPLNGTFQ